MNAVWSKVKNYKSAWVDFFILMAIAGLLLTYFEPQYLLSRTITTGGDTASHYYTAQYLKDVLLPKGQIIGWLQGNYAGFPLFMFYFPMPFIIMALLSFVVPLQIAFKLVTVLGIFLLPICTYFSLRLLRYEFPVPIFGALFVLPFLFMEANSMWGGNIPSTLAGEFAFSLGFALSILFIGSLYNGIMTERHAIKNGVLIALIGFSHGYPLLFSGLASLFFLITSQNFLKRFKYLVKVHGLGFLLMGFWIVPLLLNVPYNTRYNYVWIINSIYEVFPAILAPLVIVSILGRVVDLLRILWKNRGILGFTKESWKNIFNRLDTRIYYLWFCVLTSAFFYFIAYRINVVDIRFLPFLQIFLCIIAAVELGRAVQAFKIQWLIPVALTIPVFLWVDHYEKNVKSWIAWNYTGFEGKAMWPAFSEINKTLKGTIQDPRVVYEHSSSHNSAGTPRAFESLPLFSGRSTLEGIYMQSSVSSPFVFYIQSEISKEISCPLPDYGCSKLDLDDGIRHLQMFNVRDFIVVSHEVKSEIKKYPEFILRESIPPYELYELSTNENKYVTPLRNEPVLYQTHQWKRVSYRWFKNGQINDVHLVFTEKPGEADRKRFKTIVLGDDLPLLPKIPIETTCHVDEEIREEEISIKTDCIHQPLLIKITYHPNWKVEGADKVYLASPSFMLIFPDRENVRLSFSKTEKEYAGIFLTLTGIFMLAINLPGLSENRLRVALDQKLLKTSEALKGLLMNNSTYAAMYKFMSRYRIKLIISAWMTVAFLLSSFVVLAKREDPGVLYAKGIKYFGENKYAEARDVFGSIVKDYPDTASAVNASYYEAITYFKQGEYRKTIEEFQKLIKNYPESNWVPEAYYHMGLSNVRLNNQTVAKDTYQFILEHYPTSPWAVHARSRLTELTPDDVIPHEDPNQLYNQAMGYFDAGNYPEARRLFSRVKSEFPNTLLAEQSVYFQAICFFKENNYKTVIKEFEKFVQEYPQSHYVPEAYYHIGLSYQRLGNHTQARGIFEKVIKEYPNSRWAQFSKEGLHESSVHQPKPG
jgi:tol-pal system protein YbgF